MEIRAEQFADGIAVRSVIEDAFGRPDEADLVERLREPVIQITSLVAIDAGRIVGHAMFSRAWIDTPSDAVAVASLAPVAVRTDCQRAGIGSALIRRGIADCRSAGWPAVIVVGHDAYYPRFGFSAVAVAHLDSPYAGPHFMGLELESGALARLTGRVRYPDAFDRVT